MSSEASIVIDLGAWLVTQDGEAVQLAYREFQLLLFLVQHAGRVIRRDELLLAVWPANDRPNERAVDGYVARLRQKFGPLGPRIIRTVRKVGYRLEARDRGGSPLIDCIST